MLQELREIDRLINEENLVAAQATCKKLLKEHPTSAAAHEKMGDILFERELWEDAAEWYDLAIRLAETPELRAKRSEANQRAREARTGGPVPAPVEDDGRRRLAWLGVAAAVMLVVVVLVVIGIVRSRSGETPEDVAVNRPQGEVAEVTSPGLTGPSTVRGTRNAPTPSPGRAAEVPRARENPERHWAAVQMPRRAPRRTISRARSTVELSGPFTDHDRAVINAVSSLTWGDDRAMTGDVHAMVDPFTGYAVVRVLVPESLPTDGLIEQVVRQAYRIAQTAVNADEVISAVTIQMVATAPSGERIVAFRGNTSRKALAQVDEERPSFTMLWTQIFRDVRWNPLMAGEMPVAADQEATGGNAAS